MTRKDFRLIAETIADLPLEMADWPTRNGIAERFADRIEKDHPRFRRDLFISAATRTAPARK